MQHVCSMSLCRLVIALAVIALPFVTSVPESMGQVSDQQEASPKQTTQEQQMAAPEKTAQEAGAPPWRGPLFTLMAKMTENAKDTGSETPANKRAIRDQ